MKTYTVEGEKLLELVLRATGLLPWAKDIWEDEIIFYPSAVEARTVELVAKELDGLGLTCSTGIHPNQARYILIKQ